jgi:hypothetical protein
MEILSSSNTTTDAVCRVSMIYDAAGRSLSLPGEGKIDAARRPTRVLPHCQGSSAHAANGKDDEN